MTREHCSIGTFSFRLKINVMSDDSGQNDEVDLAVAEGSVSVNPFASASNEGFLQVIKVSELNRRLIQ